MDGNDRLELKGKSKPAESAVGSAFCEIRVACIVDVDDPEVTDVKVGKGADDKELGGKGGDIVGDFLKIFRPLRAAKGDVGDAYAIKPL